MATIRILIYALWFLFAIWAYVCIIYTVSFISFARIKARFSFYDKKAIIIESSLFFITLGIHIAYIVLFLNNGNDLMDNKSDVPVEYWVIFGLSLFFNLVYLLFFLLFSNNLAYKLTNEKIYLIGISVLNVSFINKNFNKNKDLILEYVYKFENDKKWTEKFRFWRCFTSTKKIANDFNKFIDLERNNAVFNLSQVEKPISKETSQEKTKVIDLKPKKAATPKKK